MKKCSHLANNNVVKMLYLNVHYSSILYTQPAKYSIQEDLLLLQLGTKCS